MATKQAYKRLAREYQNIQKNPPPYIIAHPSESNILEWHYILTGPPDTPYEGGQYWGTLLFPPDYPFAPPAIRMHTPSGRFIPSSRLCLSISDFHPRSFNPAWEVSTILIGLLSFMTSDEMTTGSIGATEADRKLYAAQSRWWNCTGGGSANSKTRPNALPPTSPRVTSNVGSIKAGDGGAKFRAEWPELDEANWKWMTENRIDPSTAAALHKPHGATSSATSAAANIVQQGGHAGQSWLRRNRIWVALSVVFMYVLVSRVFVEGI